MGVLLYLLVAFFVFFFMYKTHWENLQEKSRHDVWLAYKEGWLICMVPLTWIVSLPFILLWKILDAIYNKFQKNKI